MFLALPLLIFTLGLFTLVINALLLFFVSLLLGRYFVVDNFGAAFLGALVISIVSLVLNFITGTNRARVHVERQRRPPDSDRGGNGPVIDV
jgi:putative membrane protein